MKKNNLPTLDAVYEVLTYVSSDYRAVLLKLYTFFLLLEKLAPNNFLQIVTQCDFSKEIYRIEHSSREKDRQNAVEEFHDLIYDRIESYQYVLEKLCNKEPRGKNKAELQKVIDIFKIIKEQTYIKIPIEDL